MMPTGPSEREQKYFVSKLVVYLRILKLISSIQLAYLITCKFNSGVSDVN